MIHRIARTSLLSLLAAPAWAAPTFTGDAEADFVSADVVELVDPSGHDVGMPVPPFEIGSESGNDIRALLLEWDAVADVLHLGIDMYGIALDVDGDGDPSHTSPELEGLLGSDLPDVGSTESFVVAFDIDQDDVLDIVIGVPATDDVTAFRAAVFDGVEAAPSFAFGADLPGHPATLFATPSAAAPDPEMTLGAFTDLPISSGFDADPAFDVLVFVGSFNDDGIGEDVIPRVEVAFDPCGDGRLQSYEACDDGNVVSGDGCSAFCVVEFCGDGVVNDSGAEACDDGNVVSGDGCDAVCQDEYCGDGLINDAGVEECDDGNVVSGDSCTASCLLEFCGDGVVNDSGAEACDDGNVVSGDGCDAVCQDEYCGDGLINDAGVEECDDGNVVSGDSCTASCLLEFCGDGVVNDSGAEACDDGNVRNGDGCDFACQDEYCGDGLVNDAGAEACDDGNTDAGDGCDATCQDEYCGDGVVNDGGVEACDDGNVERGDGCDEDCQVELFDTFEGVTAQLDYSGGRNCGCASTGAPAGALWLVALLGWRRRRAPRA